MLERTNIETKLIRARSNRISEAAILKQVQNIFSETDTERKKIRHTLSEATEITKEITNTFNVDLLQAKQIYHLTDIEKLCVTYRLRFLDAHYFKGDFPEEAISKIRHLEKEHQTQLVSLKIVAPAKLLKLENADDPLLFAPMGNDYFYLIHKWGNDLHPLRKWLMWPYKTFENLVLTIFVISILLTYITPMQLFIHTVAMQEYVLMFLFMFKAVAGIVLFYGFAKGKNFTTAIWRSKYYNA
ncbi:hypothetical protein [Cochleicola gelatinilyticus]|uniref:Uncharacterized protein n=1 Tax=Cochleicola gelatinilyticus TaxID=1763537 RepID=A0A167HFU1_9FLAO|nr:hypothetical protein [Cochleicola gelatinilyticus]OAB78562.1 hypothetical protein ULVI_08205 [Cochleicola gelatinilyticus]